MNNWIGLLSTETVKVYEEMKSKWHLEMSGLSLVKSVLWPSLNKKVTFTSDKYRASKTNIFWIRFEEEDKSLRRDDSL